MQFGPKKLRERFRSLCGSEESLFEVFVPCVCAGGWAKVTGDRRLDWPVCRDCEGCEASKRKSTLQIEKEIRSKKQDKMSGGSAACRCGGTATVTAAVVQCTAMACAPLHTRAPYWSAAAVEGEGRFLLFIIIVLASRIF